MRCSYNCNIELIHLFVNYVILSMTAVTRKMADLKNEILAKIDEKCREFKSDFMNEIKDFRAVRVVF